MSKGEDIEVTVQHIRDYFCRINPDISRYRTTRKVAQALLLDAPIVVKGYCYDFKLKSLGAGIYEITLKPWKGHREVNE